MIYLAINLVIAVSLIIFAVYLDTRAITARDRALENILLSLGFLALLNALSILTMMAGNVRLVNLVGKTMLFLLVFFSMNFTLYCLEFPYFDRPILRNIIRILMAVSGFYLIFFKIGSYAVSMEHGIFVANDAIAIAGLSWYQLFKIIYVYGMPSLSALLLALRVITVKSKIFRQQILFILLSVLIGFSVYLLIQKASAFVPMYSTLFTIGLVVFVILLAKGTTITTLFDLTSIIIVAVSFFIKYSVSSLIIALAFVLLLPLQSTMPLLFWGIFVVVTLLILFLQGVANKRFQSLNAKGLADYEKKLDADFSAVDYNDSPPVLIENFIATLREGVDISHVTILMDQENEKSLTSVYSSIEDLPTVTIDKDNPAIEGLIHLNQSILFKTQVVTSHLYSAIKESLLLIFTATNADALIVLRESRHIFGFICLGAKRRGNDYTDYDFKTLKNLYNHFFLFGYYMKNIGNRSLIGTVDREIQFSGQIIQSIQDNIDKIQNPKTDVGYISYSARNLGGDFVDFIRLTDTRYMYIMGDVSGKGLNASMSMVILKSIIRTLLADTGDFKDLVVRVNNFIKFNLPKGTFFAGLFALIDFETNTMYYINCGIPALFLYTKSYNNVIEIQGDGKVLGFIKNIKEYLKVKKIVLNPGDIVLSCTDGLLDAESLRGERYGKSKVQSIIMENKSYSADRMVSFLYSDMLEFTSKELQDDITAVVIKYLE